MNGVDGNRVSSFSSQTISEQGSVGFMSNGVRNIISSPQFREITFCTFAFVLLLSACIKIWGGDGNASFESLLIRPSILLDLCLSAVLFFGDRNVKGALVGLSAFVVYGGYLIFLRASGNTACGCFGPQTPIYIPFAIDIFGMISFGAILVHSIRSRTESSKTSAKPTHSIFAITVTLILAFSSVSFFGKRNPALEVVSARLNRDDAITLMATLHLQIKNNLPHRVRIVGFEDSCNVLALTSVPILVDSTGVSELKFVLPLTDLGKEITSSRNFLGFVRGYQKCFVEIDGNVRTLEAVGMDWKIYH